LLLVGFSDKVYVFLSGLALEHDPAMFAFQVTRITGIYYNARLANHFLNPNVYLKTPPTFTFKISNSPFLYPFLYVETNCLLPACLFPSF
jgi:hypothetical protein